MVDIPPRWWVSHPNSDCLHPVSPSMPTPCARRLWAFLPFCVCYYFFCYLFVFLCATIPSPVGSGGGSSFSCIFFCGARCSRLVAIPSQWWPFLPSFHCMRPECPRPALVGGCCPPYPHWLHPLCPVMRPRGGGYSPPLSIVFFFGARRSRLGALYPRWWLFPLPPLPARSMPTPCARRWWLFLLGFSFIFCFFFFSGGRVVALALWLLPRKAPWV